MPNFAFYGGRKQPTTEFYFSFWAWNSASGGFAYNWQSKWVGIIAIKTEKTQIHFLSDVLLAVASLDLKVPNNLCNTLRCWWCFFGVFFVCVVCNVKDTAARKLYRGQIKKRRGRERGKEDTSSSSSIVFSFDLLPYEKRTRATSAKQRRDPCSRPPCNGLNEWPEVLFEFLSNLIG